IRLGLVDEVIPEPVGGAHFDPDAAGDALRKALVKSLTELNKIRPEKLVRRRADKYAAMGAYAES
ncbi:MAG: acetyl-CoA carboxylase carboxyl transferase subunit alpha, partial [Gemmatimonadales bacterium]